MLTFIMITYRVGVIVKTFLSDFDFSVIYNKKKPKRLKKTTYFPNP